MPAAAASDERDAAARCLDAMTCRDAVCYAPQPRFDVEVRCTTPAAATSRRNSHDVIRAGVAADVGDTRRQRCAALPDAPKMMLPAAATAPRPRFATNV